MATIRLFPKNSDRPPFNFIVTNEIARNLAHTWAKDVVNIMPKNSNIGVVFRPEDFLLMEIHLDEEAKPTAEETNESPGLTE